MATARRLATVVLVVCLLLVTSAGVASAGSITDVRQSTVDPDSVLIEIDLREDGSADWTVEYRVYLQDENESAAFEDVRDSIAADPDQYTDRFGEGIEESITLAADGTGREMSLEDVAVSTERQQLPQPTGVVRYTFTWTGFAVVEDGGERIEAGDAIDRLFVDSETRLVLTPPSGYAFVAASPPPDELRDGLVVWEGPTNFAGGEPRVELSPGGSTGADDPDTSSDGWIATLVDSGLAVVVALGVVALSGVGAWRVLRRAGHDEGDESTSVDPDADDAPTVDAVDPPRELLSNDEQVLRVLERNGGRVKQQDLVRELGWSDSKTSKVVNHLREEGTIEAFRLGRENVVSLPSTGYGDGGER